MFYFWIGMASVFLTACGPDDSLNQFSAEEIKVYNFSFERDNLDLVIPDDPGPLLSFDIDVPLRGIPGKMSLHLKVYHDYVGDLVIDLVGPNGRNARLWERAGGSATSIDKEFAMPLYFEEEFGSSSIRGKWRVLVKDNAEMDTGVLNYVKFNISRI